MFEFGAQGIEYYIILSGSVSIWYRGKEIDENFKRLQHDINSQPHVPLE